MLRKKTYILLVCHRQINSEFSFIGWSSKEVLFSMIETKQFSAWDMPATIEQKKSTNEDNDENERRRHRSKRRKTAYQKYFFQTFFNLLIK